MGKNRRFLAKKGKNRQKWPKKGGQKRAIFGHFGPPKKGGQKKGVSPYVSASSGFWGGPGLKKPGTPTRENGQKWLKTVIFEIFPYQAA